MAKRKSSNKPRSSTKTTSTRKKSPKGLGDTVETVLKKTGIAKIAKWIMGEDCGCQERQVFLNELFPYQKPNCLSESEYSYLNDHFKSGTNTITPRKQRHMLEIYNRVFNDNRKGTNCGSCFLNGVHNKLKKVYEQYESDERS